MNRQIARKILLNILMLWAMPAVVYAQQAYITLQYVDPLEKVFRETAFFPDRPAVADEARGEYATFQFAFRSNAPVTGLRATIQATSPKDAFILRNGKVGYVGYVWVGRTLPNPPADKLISPSGFFPDPILDTVQKVLPPDCTQPVWVSVKIPKGIKAGIYSGRLIVKGKAWKKNFTREARFSIHVYPVTIDSTSLWVSEWYEMSPLSLRLMNGGQNVPLYSARYWELLSVLAHKMAAYDQNVVLVSPLGLTQFGLKNGRYTFDFARFDKTVEVFKKAGALKRIEGGGLGTRMGGWNSDDGVFVPVISADTTVFEKHLISDTVAQDFYRQFIPALVHHLKEKGWYAGYTQHVADEPTNSNAASYMQIAQFIKSLAPDIHLMEACQTTKLKLDIWVPQLDFLKSGYKFYKQQQQEGKEVWFYTSMNPQGNYANRFIELPLIKTRILQWINFRYGITGYLHWGFNQWHHDPHPFEETTDQNSEGGGILPAGDAYIVYPGYGKLYSSIRLEAMRDGIDDYELLKMLARKYPGKAMDICKKEIFNFTTYDCDIQSFREKIKQMLEDLSK